MQGKHKIAKQLIALQSTLANIIMSEDYYATNLDIWLLAKHFKLPLIFFSGTELTENGQKLLVANASADASAGADASAAADSFYFIRTPGIKHDVPNSYRLVAAPKYNDKLPLTALAEDLVKNIRENRNANAFIDFLNSVSTLEATLKLKSKKIKITVVEEEPVPVNPAPVNPALNVTKKKDKKIVLTE
jgi:hypothetical protein